MEIEKTCPMGCEMPLRSDAAVKKFCEVCGMIADNGSRTLSIGSKVSSFCCDMCMKTSKRMRFSLKAKYRTIHDIVSKNSRKWSGLL